MKFDIVLIDDHSLVLEGLKRYKSKVNESFFIISIYL